MSRLFEALSGLKAEQRAIEVAALPSIAPPDTIPSSSKQDPKSEQHSLRVMPPTLGPLAVALPESLHEVKELNETEPTPAETIETTEVCMMVSPESHLVALTEPNSLGAEKFRALVTRFDHLRSRRQLKSFQVSSSVINEGKTLVAANVAVTLAKYSGSKTLLVEGDLHRPTLARLLGLSGLQGLNQWWSGEDQEFGRFVRRLNGIPLSFLGAGGPSNEPSDLLRSARFAKAFEQLASQFEWIVVDSTPMLPIVDVNLWSKVLDGTLLVVREGVTPIKALKKGLQALNHPKLIGIVVNEASESDQAGYAGQYYGNASGRERSTKKG